MVGRRFCAGRAVRDRWWLVGVAGYPREPSKVSGHGVRIWWLHSQCSGEIRAPSGLRFYRCEPRLSVRFLVKILHSVLHELFVNLLYRVVYGAIYLTSSRPYASRCREQAGPLPCVHRSIGRQTEQKTYRPPECI